MASITSLHPYLQSILYQIEEADDVWTGRDAWFQDDTGLTSSAFVDDQRTKNKAIRYLPQGSGERPNDYVARLRQADWKPKYRQAIEKDFSSILTQFDTVDLHEAVDSGNFDRNGNSLKAIAKDYIAKALHLGMSAMFIDSSADRGGAPTITLYKRTDILDWDIQTIDGQRVLTMVALKDMVEAAAADDSVSRLILKERYKRLTMVPTTDGPRMAYELVEIGENQDGQKIETVLESNITDAPRITLIPLAISTNPFYTDLPLIHLARLNIQLYRKEANRDYYLDKCACPTLNLNDIVPSPPGQTPEISITIGPNTVIRNFEAKWLELSGTAMEQITSDIDRLIEQIDQEALAFLAGSVQKTATQSVIDTFQTQANLVGMATFLESAMQNVFRDYVCYATGDWDIETAGTIDLSIAIDTLKMMVSGEITDIFSAITEGIITRDLGLRLLKIRGFFGRGFSDADLTEELMKQGAATGLPADNNGATTVPVGI